QAGAIAGGILTGVGTATSLIFTLFVVIVLTFFFLKDGHRFLPWARTIAGRRIGWHLTESLTRAWTTLSGFIRAQAAVPFVCAVVGMVSLGRTQAVIALCIVRARQQLQGNTRSPCLQPKAMNLHRVIVLVSGTIGGGLFGLVGSFLAVPVAAMRAGAFRYLQ